MELRTIVAGPRVCVCTPMLFSPPLLEPYFFLALPLRLTNFSRYTFELLTILRRRRHRLWAHVIHLLTSIVWRCWWVHCLHVICIVCLLRLLLLILWIHNYCNVEVVNQVVVCLFFKTPINVYLCFKLSSLILSWLSKHSEWLD